MLIVGCGVSNQNTSNVEKESENSQSNLSLFFVLNIRNGNENAANVVELISKNEIAGKMKTESAIRSPNYLTFYLYSDKQLVDSVSIDHPLYKHFEYPDSDGSFRYKDTIIDNADFVLRAESTINEIQVFETLKEQSRKQLILKNF